MDERTISERDKKVSHWAYRIWLAEGQPEGRAEVHHRLAQAMVDMQETEMTESPTAPKPTRQKAVKPAASLAPNDQAQALVDLEDPAKSPGKPAVKLQNGKNPASRQDSLRPSPEPKGKAIDKAAH
jgi:hypothetical protein